MAETGTVQTLEIISSEVEQSQIQVLLSTQGIKARAYLVNKLEKETNHSKQLCSIINDANMKLKFEIKQAQKTIESMIMAQETLKMVNVELKKECHVAKYKKMAVMERVQNGIKKYENLWVESKARYESLPFMKKLIKVKDEVKDLEQKIAELGKNERTLLDQIKTKKISCSKLDRERVIELANFIVNQMPKNIHIIIEKAADIAKITNELKTRQIKAICNDDAVKPTLPKETKEKIEECFTDSSLILPKLQLGSLDFADDFKPNFVEINMKQVYDFEKKSNKTVSKINKNTGNDDEYSPYFSKPSAIYDENKNQNYAKKKLINIIEDIKIDKNTAVTMMTKVYPEKFYPVDSIAGSDKNAAISGEIVKDKIPTESEEIEEIDIPSKTENLLIPPTQFLDTTVFENKQKEEELVPASPKTRSETPNSSQILKNSQEYRKKVSFDIPNIVETDSIDADKPEKLEKIDANETSESQLNVSAVSDEGFAKIKDMIMKKHNLASSPPFIFAKNTLTSLNLQKPGAAAVTSKFFHHEQVTSQADPPILENNVSDVINVMKTDQASDIDKDSTNVSHLNVERKRVNEMDGEYSNMASQPKKKNKNEIEINKTVVSYMPTHGTQLTSEYLDGSITTMEYEDGDADFPHCIDSSLLLSPKADYPIPEACNKPEKISQDAPNFLSGLRKTGLSFFGSSSPSEYKTDSSAQNQGGGGFSFNFGGEEKKSRGGLFSMFQ